MCSRAMRRGERDKYVVDHSRSAPSAPKNVALLYVLSAVQGRQRRGDAGRVAARAYRRGDVAVRARRKSARHTDGTIGRRALAASQLSEADELCRSGRRQHRRNGG
jgi:hypothetical protein